MSVVPESLRSRLCRLLACCPPVPPPQPAVVLRFQLTRLVGDGDGGLITFDPKGQFMLLLTDTQKATLTLDPRDAKGKPASLDGTPAWSVADPTVATLVVATDGLSADVVAGDPGATQVNVTADAKIGPDVKEIVGTLDVQVSAGEAVSLGISAGAPVEQ